MRNVAREGRRGGQGHQNERAEDRRGRCEGRWERPTRQDGEAGSNRRGGERVGARRCTDDTPPARRGPASPAAMNNHAPVAPRRGSHPKRAGGPQGRGGGCAVGGNCARARFSPRLDGRPLAEGGPKPPAWPVKAPPEGEAGCETGRPVGDSRKSGRERARGCLVPCIYII